MGAMAYSGPTEWCLHFGTTYHAHGTIYHAKTLTLHSIHGTSQNFDGKIFLVRQKLSTVDIFRFTALFDTGQCIMINCHRLDNSPDIYNQNLIFKIGHYTFTFIRTTVDSRQFP